MKYSKTITLRDGRSCTLRNGTENDGKEVLEVFRLTHEQTDFLLTYPDEMTFTVEQECQFLHNKEESENSVEILAEVDGRIVGSAGIECVGDRFKTRHRADFGMSIDKAYWGLGIGTALTKACIECAAKAGYTQLELQVVSDNTPALELYRKAGFTEYGRNPMGFRSRHTGWQELVLMRLVLNDER